MDGETAYELLGLADVLQFDNNYARISFKALL